VGLEPEEISRGALLYESLPPGCKPPLDQTASEASAHHTAVGNGKSTQILYKICHFQPLFLNESSNFIVCAELRRSCAE
jgi:hypothetical protein